MAADAGVHPAEHEMKRMSRGRWALVVGAVFCLAELKLGPTYVLAQGDTSPKWPAITDARLRAHVKFLADDLLEGRGPSTRGGNLAANYIATEFKLLGLAPGAGDGSYFQMVTMVESKTDAGKGLTISGGAGAPEVLAPAADTVVGTGVEDPDVSVDADLVFLGYGINAPERGWNDFAGLDLQHRVPRGVFVLGEQPGRVVSRHGLLPGKAVAGQPADSARQLHHQ